MVVVIAKSKLDVPVFERGSNDGRTGLLTPIGCCMILLLMEEIVYESHVNNIPGSSFCVQNLCLSPTKTTKFYIG